MARAGLVFVRRVVELTNSGRWATFAVEDIWKGTLDGGRVDVRGGARDGRGTSVDRTWVLGTSYLVFAELPPTDPGLRDLYGDGARWTDNACSSSQPYAPDLATSRPGTARLVADPSPQEPSAGRADPPAEALGGDRGASDGSIRLWMSVAAVAVLGLAGGAAVRTGRRSRSAARSG